MEKDHIVKPLLVLMLDENWIKFSLNLVIRGHIDYVANNYEHLVLAWLVQNHDAIQYNQIIIYSLRNCTGHTYGPHAARMALNKLQREQPRNGQPLYPITFEVLPKLNSKE